MKRAIPVVGVVMTAMLLGSAAPSPSEVASPGPCVCHKAVRTDYILQGNNTPSDTFCEILNTSASTPIVLLNVYVLGSGGVNNVLITHTNLNGQVVPPLGRVRIDVNNTTFPGLSPGSGVANVVVGWSGGSLESVQLTSNTARYCTCNQENRTEVHYEGHPIVL